MPKVTYFSCGESVSRGHFFSHKKKCGTLEHRVQCPLCPLTFAFKKDMQWHVRQQHSNNPLRFPCTICDQEFSSTQNLRLHMVTIHVDIPPCYCCWYCNATFTWKISRQQQMRKVHGRRCREQEVNLHPHLQHLSEDDHFQNEWLFVESRPIEPGEHDVCPCGQTPIHSYFFIENKWNGNRNFAGSDCIENIDPKAGEVIYYFNHILHHGVKGIYKGQDDKGLKTFTVSSNTTLVRRLPIIEHLIPPLTRNLDGQWEVPVLFPKAECLLLGQSYSLRLKAKYGRGRLTFTAL